MTAAQLRKLIGKRIAWDETLCANRGTYVTRTGTLHDVRGKNLLVGLDWRWRPTMRNIREATEHDNNNAR